jgi:dienelactone hydrolase
MKFLLAVLMVALLAGGAQAKLVTRTVEYTQGDTVCKGYLAYDDAAPGKRPGVLVVHEFWGLNDFARKKAEQLAQMGYVAFAADIYGGGQVTKDFQEAAKWSAALKNNPPLLRARALAALKALSAHEPTDPRRLAAIGFCFGGTTVLELAYAGADLVGVVSFHGGLPPAQPEDQKRLKARFLILHGADDPHVPPTEVMRFLEAIREGVDWQLIAFGGVVHSFTNPEAGRDKSKGVAYDPLAAKRSWRYMQVFLEEIFAVPAPGGNAGPMG